MKHEGLVVVNTASKVQSHREYERALKAKSKATGNMRMGNTAKCSLARTSGMCSKSQRSRLKRAGQAKLRSTTQLMPSARHTLRGADAPVAVLFFSFNRCDA
jgi:hypothetical protein